VTVDRSIGFRAARVLLVCSLSLAAPAISHADRRVDPEAAAKDREAREHYTQGMRHFDLGEVDDAIKEFRAAYQISAAPGLLFNIAQAYRTKKDYENALQFYKNYLRLQPRAPNRVDVEARVAEMEKLVEQQAQMEKERPHGVIPPNQEAVETPEAPPAPAPAPATPVVAARPAPRFLSTTGGRASVALAALTGLTAITAAALGGVALSARNDYHSGCDRGVCDDAVYDRAHRLAIGSDVLWGLTAASAVAALTVGLLTRSSLHKGVYARAAGIGGTF
jgi:tetratricopeptide (TPR) repeat protein